MNHRLQHLHERQHALAVAAVCALAALSFLPARAADEPAQPAKNPSEKWEKDIKRFEEKDQASPPPKGEVLFVGSSSIVKLKNEKWFPNVKAVNRGFGGSHIADSVYYFDRIVKPYEPKVIVFHAGGNDIAAGKTPETVCEDFKAFVKKVHDTLPKTKLIFMQQQPSGARWKIWPKTLAANQLIAEYCKTDPLLATCDVSKVLLGENGEPLAELFEKDKLHMSEAGYKVWTALLEPVLMKALKE
ncbi:MAG TPA: GDSL-type esterase/lipase family protein [Planctomycetota bacterium]|jgi:lysophospholipase L1-like esterase